VLREHGAEGVEDDFALCVIQTRDIEQDVFRLKLYSGLPTVDNRRHGADRALAIVNDRIPLLLVDQRDLNLLLANESIVLF